MYPGHSAAATVAEQQPAAEVPVAEAHEDAERRNERLRRRTNSKSLGFVAAAACPALPAMTTSVETRSWPRGTVSACAYLKTG